jgi:predicted DNA-binding protein (MmcQ/YjbR family)
MVRRNSTLHRTFQPADSDRLSASIARTPPVRYAGPVAKNISQAVREICLSFPEAEEFLSHGSPNFRVRGKTFATYVVNHHGDGRVALWLNSASGAQEHHTQTDPKHFFIPPYVGPRGWLGVHLNKNLSWKLVAALVREAYEKSAPRILADSLGKLIEIKPPDAELTAEDVDPMQARRAQVVLKALRRICLSWPETSEDLQFGFPVWRAGKKTFATIHCGRNQGGQRGAEFVRLHFWVGIAAQGLMITDERYEIPPYMGHNGWIALNVTGRCDCEEVRALALASYRHFALQRMLKMLL